MNKAKVKKNIVNLKKIKEIIQISKFDTLQKLNKETKVSDTYLEMALSAKALIDFAYSTYKIKEKRVKNKINKTLWVYVTPDLELMSISNAKFEKIIKNNFDKENDIIISLGDKAEKFVKRENLNPEFSSQTTKGHENALAVSIWTFIIKGIVSSVKFVINTPKIKEEAITIFPMHNLNLDTKKLNLRINKHYKFYPSINTSLISITQIYIFRIVHALIKESQYLHLKEKLIRHEASIKSVDAKMELKIRDMNKLNRKQETEELILVSQIAKRGVENE